MERLIPVVNKLQEIAVQANIEFDIKLPRIVAVGAQASGKSSVLELIVGKEILPHGSEVITKAPIILELEKSDEEYAILKHKPGKVYTNYIELKEEIKTSLMTQGISNEPVQIKLYSPQVLDITLIDLPGITRVPLVNQPNNFATKLRKLIKSFINNSNSLILAITPANIDIANSDALQLAREVDPEGERTIGVITKIDLASEEDDVVRVIEGKEYPLKLGYIGVMCRSQEDIKEGKSLEKALKDERIFIRNSVYNSIKDLCGIDSLIKKLSQILVQHISEKLPSLKSCIESQLRLRKDELLNYGISLTDNSEACHSQLLFLISKYSEYYHASLEGNSKVNQADEYKSGARIHILIQEGYVKEVNSINPLENLSDEDILKEIFNAKALRPGLFIPEAAFESLTKTQIKRLLLPSLQCADKVYDELLNVAINPPIPELTSFGKVQKKIAEIMKNLLKSYLEPTKEMITDLIEIESGHININHPDVLVNCSIILSSLKTHKPKKKSLSQLLHSSKEPTLREGIELEITKSLMRAYFEVVLIRMTDVIPKTIMSFLVNKSLSEIHNTLIHRIMMEKNWMEFLEEDPLMVKKRRECRILIDSLTNSKRIINEFMGI